MTSKRLGYMEDTYEFLSSQMSLRHYRITLIFVL